MFQRPLVLFRCPLMSMEPSLMIWMWCFVRRAAQSLSQSWPREMRELVCSPGRMWHFCALCESCWCSGRCARWVAGMMDPLAAVMEGPVLVEVTLVQCWRSSGQM